MEQPQVSQGPRRTTQATTARRASTSVGKGANVAKSPKVRKNYPPRFLLSQAPQGYGGYGGQGRYGGIIPLEQTPQEYSDYLRGAGRKSPTFKNQEPYAVGRRPTGKQSSRWVGVETKALASFIKSHPNCTGISQDQLGKELERFITLTKPLTRSALQALVTVIEQSGEFPQLSLRFRAALNAQNELAFGASGIQGRKPVTKTTVRPETLLWGIADQACKLKAGGLKKLNDLIEEFLAGEGLFQQAINYNDKEIYTADVNQRNRINNALVSFLQFYPNCEVDRDKIFYFLQLIDQLDETGSELYNDARYAALVHQVTGIPTRNWRAVRDATGHLALVPATLGVKGVRGLQIKESLLWAILRQYCSNIDPINRELASILRLQQQHGIVGTSPQSRAQTLRWQRIKEEGGLPSPPKRVKIQE